MKTNFSILGVVATLLASAPASATWSIVAVDEATGEVGAAVASCFTGTGGVFDVPGVSPGVGAVASQAVSSVEGRDEALRLMDLGEMPADIISSITDSGFDESAGFRQYGVAVRGEAPANFTGDQVTAAFDDYSGLRTGTTLNVAVQGNLLRGPEVLDDALSAFEALEGRVTLADRLVAALQAGAEAGGDGRCSVEQTAISAILLVAEPDDSANAPSTRIEVEFGPGADNPVTKLVADYETMFGTIASREGSGSGGGCAVSHDASATGGALLSLLLMGVVARRRVVGRLERR